MKSQRTSFHITPQSLTIVGEDGDKAKRINFLIGACAEMMESPQFNENEWMILIASGNGILPRYQDGLYSVLHSFANGIPYSAIYGSEYVEIDKQELAQRYWNLPKNQKLFVFELARKFWLPKNIPIINYTEWLIANGAIVK